MVLLYWWKSFDDKLINYLVDNFKEKYDIDLSKDIKVYQGDYKKASMKSETLVNTLINLRNWIQIRK